MIGELPILGLWANTSTTYAIATIRISAWACSQYCSWILFSYFMEIQLYSPILFFFFALLPTWGHKCSTLQCAPAATGCPQTLQNESNIFKTNTPKEYSLPATVTHFSHAYRRNIHFIVEVFTLVCARIAIPGSKKESKHLSHFLLCFLLFAFQPCLSDRTFQCLLRRMRLSKGEVRLCNYLHDTAFGPAESRQHAYPLRTEPYLFEGTVTDGETLFWTHLQSYDVELLSRWLGGGPSLREGPSLKPDLVSGVTVGSFRLRVESEAPPSAMRRKTKWKWPTWEWLCSSALIFCGWLSGASCWLLPSITRNRPYCSGSDTLNFWAHNWHTSSTVAYGATFRVLAVQPLFNSCSATRR